MESEDLHGMFFRNLEDRMLRTVLAMEAWFVTFQKESFVILSYDAVVLVSGPKESD